MIKIVNGFRNANVYYPEWLTASGFPSERMPRSDVSVEETMLPSTVVGANNCYKRVDDEDQDEKRVPEFKYIGDDDPHFARF